MRRPFLSRKLPWCHPTGVIYQNKPGRWHMTPAVIHLFHHLTGIEKGLLERTSILKRTLRHPAPWFRSARGGGAIVLGTKRKPVIIFTGNFFLREIYGRKSKNYGNRLDVWLDMLSHEIGHLPQLQSARNTITYMLHFGWQYLRTFSHDNAPLEKEAERCRQAYRKFNMQARNWFGPGALFNLLRQDITEEEKIKTLDTWLERYDKL